MSRLQDDITELAAHLHAGTAALVRQIADLDEGGEWQGIGMRSCAHWLCINCGFDMWHATELVRAGHALRELPLIAAAFQEGRLSFDKVRALTHVACAADEHLWLDLGLQASGEQLARICRAFRRATETDGPDRAAAQQEKRRLTTWWREDGMLEIFATLPPEDGRLVLNAVEAAMAKPAENGVGPGKHPADSPVAARRADALVSVCEWWLGGGAAASDASQSPVPRRLVVHIDAETLIDPGSGGRCHLEDGPALSASAARRVGCDSELLAVIERGGVPVDVGRTRRVVSPRLRRALQLRDGTCRYPACPVPARRTDGHHIKHWIDGGPTDMANLVSLCEFHHSRHHEGQFTIAVGAGGALRFVGSDQRPIGATPHGVDLSTGGEARLRDLAVVAGPAIAPDTAKAGDRGASFDLGYAVEVLAHNTALAAARASPLTA